MHIQAKKGWLPLAGMIVADPVQGWGDFPAAVNDSMHTRYTYVASPDAQVAVTPVPFLAALAPYLGVKNLPDKDWNAMDLALNAKDGVWRRFICPDTDAYAKQTISMRGTPMPADQGTMMASLVGGTEISAWSTNTDYGLNEGVFGFHYDPKYSHNRLAGNVTRIHRASEIALFTDAIRRPVASFFWMPDGWVCWTPSYNGTGKATLGDAWANNGRVADKSNFDLTRHFRRINVAFLDGHVETLPLKKESLDHVLLVPP